MSGNILSEETAREQVQTMLDYYDIDFDVDFEDDDGSGDSKRAALRAHRHLIKETMRGRLDFEEDESGNLLITQHLKHPLLKNDISKIVYRPVTGRAKTAMRAAGQNDLHGKIYAFLGGLTGQGKTVIEAMQGTDLRTAENLGLLFLAV